jgi:hypothetical protein
MFPFDLRNQNPYIEEEQTTQWLKEKVQKDKHISNTERVTRTSLKTGCELRCSGRLGSSCSNSGTRRVILATSLVISHEWRKNREVFTTSGKYSWSFVTQIFHSFQCMSIFISITTNRDVCLKRDNFNLLELI